MNQQDPNLKVEDKEDTTYEDELYAYAEMTLGRPVQRYTRQEMGKKGEGQLV